MSHLTVKMKFLKKCQKSSIIYGTRFSQPKYHIPRWKLWTVAWNQKFTRVICVKLKISKNQKSRFFLMSQGPFNPKIRFLGQKVCHVACLQTDTQSDYCGHPFRVSGCFPSTYHQGSAQKWHSGQKILTNWHLTSWKDSRIKNDHRNNK